MSHVAWASLKSRVQVIKHQEGAGEGREGLVDGLVVASGLTIGSGQVGSQPQVESRGDGSCSGRASNAPY